jgi:DNA-binding CsgD family transcriptional regulator
MQIETVTLFSHILLDLYHLASHTPPNQFQEKAFDRVREVFSFDYAMWGTGKMVFGIPIFHTSYWHGYPPEFHEEYQRLKHLDVVALKLFSSIGCTIAVSPFSSPWREQFHAEMLKFSVHFKIAHSLISLFSDIRSNLAVCITFTRSDPDEPFTESERLLKQLLIPHFIEAWWINWFKILHSDLPMENYATAVALCDKNGWLHYTGEGFYDFMERQWPHWKGQQLPDVLQTILSEKKSVWEAGHSIVVMSERVVDMWIITIRKKTRLDEISKREMEVARCFGKGMRASEIADILHIALSTVKNHLRVIYKKLGIQKKTDLAALVTEIENRKKRS